MAKTAQPHALVQIIRSSPGQNGEPLMYTTEWSVETKNQDENATLMEVIDIALRDLEDRFGIAFTLVDRG